MTATITPLRNTRPHDPALGATLAELTQLGLTVARVTARLATVEDGALDAVAAAATATARILATPPASLDEARRAGHDADLSEAARDAAVARVAIIAECFEKAARAVRRTVALQARLQTGRPFHETSPAGATLPTSHDRTPPRSPKARDAEAADDRDRPESGDELGAATDDEILRSIRHDLSSAASNVTQLGQDTRMGCSPPPLVPPSNQPPDRPGAVLAAAPPPASPGPPPAPDT